MHASLQVLERVRRPFLVFSVPILFYQLDPEYRNALCLFPPAFALSFHPHDYDILTQIQQLMAPESNTLKAELYQVIPFLLLSLPLSLICMDLEVISSLMWILLEELI